MREDQGVPLGRVLPGTGLQLMQQELAVPGHTYRLVVPQSVDQVGALLRAGRPLLVCQARHRSCAQVFDVYIARGEDDADPYWCRPWPSALALAQLLTAQPELVRGRRVLELGCGLGLAGIAAARAGAIACPLASSHNVRNRHVTAVPARCALLWLQTVRTARHR